MRLSKTFVKTLREAPKDETAKNGALLTRAGYIHKEMAGVYDFLPLGIRVMENIKNIIRDELNKLGCEELQMTALQNPEPWEKTGRFSDQAVDIWFKTNLASGGELGLASKSIFWPAFSDAAMSLRPGVISQIVETPDGFHIIEVLEKKGDMFNARHILIKPQYTRDDRDKAFHTLDSLRNEIISGAVTFPLAARFYSEDPATRTNGGQMADPSTGSAYFEIDQLKPQDYEAIRNLKEGEMSEPVESLDNEGRSGNTVYKIIRVDKILPAHTATFSEDYSQLLSQVRQNLQIKAIDKFIEEKIKTTYIVIDPIFRECEFNRGGWASKFRE